MAPSNFKRKKAQKKLGAKKPRKMVEYAASDDEIKSDTESEEEVEDKSTAEEDPDSGESEEETAQEKHLRLSQKYLDQLKKKGEEEAEAEAIDKAALASRLRDDELERLGKLQRAVAVNYMPVDTTAIVYKKKHSLPVTALAISSDDKYIFTASHDGFLIKWSAETLERIKFTRGEVAVEKNNKKRFPKLLTLALSSDSKFLVAGGLNKAINIFDPDNLERIRTLEHAHKDIITGLVFRKNSHQLFSCSLDKHLKIWDLDHMSFMDYAVGHEGAVNSIDCLLRETPVTCGSDSTVIMWKPADDASSIFNFDKKSLDCIRKINDQHFVTGGQEGILAVWHSLKKKPIATVPKAHGVDPLTQNPRWISTVGTLPYSDLIASGSCDGAIKMWRFNEGPRKLSHLFDIPMEGFINDLRFFNSGTKLVAAVGKEHRLGRWWVLSKPMNALAVVPLRQVSSTTNGEPVAD